MLDRFAGCAALVGTVNCKFVPRASLLDLFNDVRLPQRVLGQDNSLEWFVCVAFVVVALVVGLLAGSQNSFWCHKYIFS